MLVFDNVRSLLLNRLGRRAPTQQLPRPLSLPSRVQTPADGLEASHIKRCLASQVLLLKLLDEPEPLGVSGDLLRKLGPDVLPVFAKIVASLSPELSVELVRCCSFY